MLCINRISLWIKKLILFAGEQDVRVLTLAEQFIAAMPDHIKVDTKLEIVHCTMYTIFLSILSSHKVLFQILYHVLFVLNAVFITIFRCNFCTIFLYTNYYAIYYGLLKLNCVVISEWNFIKFYNYLCFFTNYY